MVWPRKTARCLLLRPKQYLAPLLAELVLLSELRQMLHWCECASTIDRVSTGQNYFFILRKNINFGFWIGFSGVVGSELINFSNLVNYMRHLIFSRKSIWPVDTLTTDFRGKKDEIISPFLTPGEELSKRREWRHCGRVVWRLSTGQWWLMCVRYVVRHKPNRRYTSVFKVLSSLVNF